MKHMTILKSVSAVALAVVLLPTAQADDNPFWSLAIGVPGVVANLGNVYPVAPQPVYMAPPVQYVPAPSYYMAQPYAPVPQYQYERPRRWRGDHRGEGEHGDGGDR